MTMVGLGSIILHNYTSSFGRTWGALGLVWGIAFLAAAEIEHRRRRAT